MNNALRIPQTAAEHAALVAYLGKVSPLVRDAIASMKRRGARITSAPFKGRIFAGPSGDEAVVVVTVNGDPYAERLAWDEANLAADLKIACIRIGLYVGGVPTGNHREVWLRGPVVGAAAA